MVQAYYDEVQRLWAELKWDPAMSCFQNGLENDPMRDSLSVEYECYFLVWLTETEATSEEILAVTVKSEKLFNWPSSFLVMLIDRIAKKIKDEKLLMKVIQICEENIGRFEENVRFNVTQILSNLRSSSFEQWHINMINDLERNTKFREAIHKSIRSPDDVVFDIGTGTGLLACFAAEKSANVTGIEENCVLIDIAKDVVRLNERNVTLVEQHSLEYNPVNKANVIISETMDCCVFGEHIISTFIDAHKRLAAPDAVFIPKRAVVYAFLLQDEALWRNHSIGNYRSEYVPTGNEAPSDPYWAQTSIVYSESVRRLSKKVAVIDADFTSIDALTALQSFQKYFSFDVEEEGYAHFICVDFRAELADDVWIDTSEPGSCWDVGLFPLANPLPVRGEHVTAIVSLIDGRLDIYLDQKSEFESIAVEVIQLAHELGKVLPSLINEAGKFNQVRPLVVNKVLDEFCGPHISRAFPSDGQPVNTLFSWPFRNDGTLDDEEIEMNRKIVQMESCTVTRIVPGNISIHGQFFNSDLANVICREDASRHCGVDLSPIKKYNLTEYRNILKDISDIERVSSSFELLNLSMNVAELKKTGHRNLKRVLNITIKHDTVTDGILYFSPLIPSPQAVSAFIFDSRLEMKKGDKLQLTVHIHDGKLIVYGTRVFAQ